MKRTILLLLDYDIESQLSEIIYKLYDGRINDINKINNISAEIGNL